MDQRCLTFSTLGLGAPTVRDWDAVDLLGGGGDALLEVCAEEALLLLCPLDDATAVHAVIVVEAVFERVPGQRQGRRAAVPASYAAPCLDILGRSSQ